MKSIIDTAGDKSNQHILLCVFLLLLFVDKVKKNLIFEAVFHYQIRSNIYKICDEI